MSTPEGESLAAEFLRRAWPNTLDPEVDRVPAVEAARMAYEKVELYRRRALSGKGHWSHESVVEVDLLVRAIAETGAPFEDPEVSPGAAHEIWRRLSYGIARLTLQDLARSGFAVPVPRQAPAPIRHTAVMIAVLAGIGREYRTGRF